MSDKSFDKAMSQIAAQADAEQKRELEIQRRQRLHSKIRRVLLFLFGAALLACGFYYRTELEQVVNEKVLNKPTAEVDGNTGAALKGIQSQADKRDKVLDDINK